MSAPATRIELGGASARPLERRWAALAFIAIAQLMIALDATIMSIALPTAQRALQASDADRQWVITAYTLAFGGLLLLGGRLADQLGRKQAFLIGLGGFALASGLGGWAPSLVVLIVARALQGAFAALLAPTALSLLAVTFTEPKERATAFAVFGAIAGSGAAAGMLLGGVLTQYLTWRWCLYVNVPIAVVAAAGAATLLPSRRAQTGRGVGGFDLPGAILGTGGLVALVYACTRAVAEGWGSPGVLWLLAASAILLTLFVLQQLRAPQPLLPLRIVLARNRGGAYLTVVLTLAGMFGAFLFLTYYLQQVLRFTPLEAGLAFLPITIASQAGSWLLARRLMPRVQPRVLMVPGALTAAAGMSLLTQLHPSASYLTLVLPAEVLLGLGTACVMVPAFSLGTLGVDRRDAGAAAATVNTAQQVGASVGTAVLNTIAASAAVAAQGGAALVHGYQTAAAWGTVILLLAALLSALLIDARPPRELARG